MSDIIRIPNFYYSNFRREPYESSRNILSVPMGALHPLFRDVNKIKSNLVDDTLDNPFDKDSWSFDDNFKGSGLQNRYMHIDIGVTRDSLGVSMVHVSDWKEIEQIKYGEGKKVDTLPCFTVDFLAKIKPQEQINEEIDVTDIRELIIYKLRELGFNLNLITYDRFGSLESIRILRNEGFNIGKLSLDRTTSYPIVDYDREDNVRSISTKGNYSAAWDNFIDAVKQGRIKMPYNSSFFYEMKHAEKLSKGDRIKIDVPNEHLTLDLMESIAGSIFNAMNNEHHGTIRESDVKKEEDDIDRQFYEQFKGDRNFDELKKRERKFNSRRRSNKLDTERSIYDERY